MRSFTAKAKITDLKKGMLKPMNNPPAADDNLSIGNVRGSSHMVPIVLLLAYLIVKPFYLFPSGGPQIADAFVILLSLWSLFAAVRLPRDTAGVFTSCIYFSVYTFFVNAIWSAFTGELTMLIIPAFYFFNTIIIFTIFTFHALAREKALRILMIGIVLSLVVQSILSLAIVGSGGLGRISLFFNNPNQLGYWGLLTVSAFCVLSRTVSVRIIWHLIIFALGFYLIALSLSKAAIVALGFLFALHFSKKWWHFILAAICGAILLLVLHDQPILQDLVARLSNIGEQRDDSFTGRGYTRIWDHPEYLLFGAAEYGLSRFPGATHELHSTLGTLFFSYGVIGSFLFSIILLRLFKHAGISNFLYLAPAFAYGLTHQGLRFSLLWVLFAALAVTGRQRQAGESQPYLGGAQGHLSTQVDGSGKGAA